MNEENYEGHGHRMTHGYPLCDGCLQQFIAEWEDGQYELDDLIRIWFPESKAVRDEAKRYVLFHIVPKSICDICGRFFFPRRPSKYCSRKCKDKAYYQRKVEKSRKKVE